MTEPDVVERIRLPPDAALVKSLGTHHSLASALADLVDNSIDARATRVRVRLLTDAERLDCVEVHDDGRGLDSQEATAAMTLGLRRDYTPTDLGHFGIGLKAASFGHADVLTLWSARDGDAPQGRRIRRADFSRDFSCEVLSAAAASEATAARAALLGRREGTTVVWTELRSGYRGDSVGDARRWLETTRHEVQAHLGLVFHRLIADGRIVVDLLMADRHDSEDAVAVPVAPVDPFGYATSGHPDYPKILTAHMKGRDVALTCHIWPGRTDITGFRIGGRAGKDFQGFFVYRNDRLLQAGGWAQTANHGINLQLARVVLDDPEAVGSLVTMNPEKHGLRSEADFHQALSTCRATDGTTFGGYLQDAEAVYVESRRRTRTRRPAIAPDKGFAPQLRRAIQRELPMLAGPALQLKWSRLPVGDFLDVDYTERTLRLNARYRYLYAPGRGSLNDAPLVKALLYLLTHQVFEGQHLGARDKDEIALWQAILGAAVLTEEQMRGEQDW